MEFSKLYEHIRPTFKKTLMHKKIYIGQHGRYVNRCLANLIFNKHLLACNKNDFHNYKIIYLTSKA